MSMRYKFNKAPIYFDSQINHQYISASDYRSQSSHKGVIKVHPAFV